MNRKDTLKESFKNSEIIEVKDPFSGGCFEEVVKVAAYDRGLKMSEVRSVIVVCSEDGEYRICVMFREGNKK